MLLVQVEVTKQAPVVTLKQLPETVLLTKNKNSTDNSSLLTQHLVDCEVSNMFKAKEPW